MPKYRRKKGKAVFYDWGLGKVCPQCGGKLEPIPEYTDTKK